MKIKPLRTAAVLTLGSLLSGCWHYSNSGGVVKWHGFDESRGRTEHTLDDADASTFHSVGFHIIEDDWAIDSKHAWYQGQLIHDLETHDPVVIDPASFMDLGGLFAKDRSHVLYADRLTTADPENFKVLGRGWGYDGKNLYYEGRPAAADCTFEFDAGNLRKQECESYRVQVSPR